MYITASELYNDLLEIYFDKYNDLLGAKRSKVAPKYDHANLTLDEYDFSKWYKELDELPPLKDDEGKYYTASSIYLSKEGKGLKILTPKKLLARLPMLLVTFH